MATLAALCTVVSMATFLGICWWAWSAGRRDANRESAWLPFALPDEAQADRTAPAPRRAGHESTRTDIQS